jgi:hypothetical protein
MPRGANDVQSRLGRLEMELEAAKAAHAEARTRIARLEHALRQRSLLVEALDGGTGPMPLAPGSGAVAAPQVSRSRPAPSPEASIAFLRPHLDRAYYLKTNPDVARAAMDPVHHYVMYGEAEGRTPRADFDPVRYRLMNPALAQFQGNLFWHFLTSGDDQSQTRKG